MATVTPRILKDYRCTGTKRDARGYRVPCTRILFQADPTIPTLVIRICDRCGERNEVLIQ